MVDSTIKEMEISGSELKLSHPLFFVYDSEGTGGVVYRDCIIEIAASLQPLPDSLQIKSKLEFQSLVKTSRPINPIGMTLIIYLYLFCKLETFARARCQIDQ